MSDTDPKQVSRLPAEPPIFDYRPLLPSRRTNKVAHRPPRLIPSDRPLVPRFGELCARGYCVKCGKALIDATRADNGHLFRAHCGRCYQWPK